MRNDRVPWQWRKTLSWVGVALLAVTLTASRANAWNATGHLIIAGMAYDRLTPAVRERVDDLIRKHPDYNTILLRGATGDAATKARMAFMVAAAWPDIIRVDPRFYNDNVPGTPATPTLAGFPDMKRHADWHAIGTPFSTDGTKLEPSTAPNALTELPRLIAEMTGSGTGADLAYDLPWFLHIAADVHNPVHAATRFSTVQPQGDFIATRVVVSPGGTLHAVWDSALGEETSLEAANRSITQFAAEFAQSNQAGSEGLRPKQWMEESFDLAKAQAYMSSSEAGSREQPVMLDTAYLENTRKISRRQAALAANRIASILGQIK